MNTEHLSTQGQKIKGFTLIELLIVIAVIGILLAIAVPAFIQSREKARDARRISDIQQIQFALDVYKEAKGAYPPSDEGGTVIGEGGALDSTLAGYMSIVPKDPLSGSGGGEYHYIYDDSSVCGGAAVVYAEKMERAVNDNSATVCSGLTPPDVSDKNGPKYVVVLGLWSVGGNGGTNE